MYAAVLEVQQTVADQADCVPVHHTSLVAGLVKLVVAVCSGLSPLCEVRLDTAGEGVWGPPVSSESHCQSVETAGATGR